MCTMTGTPEPRRGSRPFNRRRIGGWLLAAAAATSQAPAAQLEVVLQTPGGEPLSDQSVDLRPVVAGREPCATGIGGRDFRFTERTNDEGAAVFEQLAPGSYAICGRFGPGLVDPADNPLGPARTVTLSSDDDAQRVSIELWRSARMIARMSSDRSDTPQGTLHLHERSLDLERRYALVEGSHRELNLLPGSWEARLEPPPGFTIVHVEVDGAPRGELPVAWVVEESATSFIEWKIAAPCTIEGRVVTRTGPAVGVGIVAERIDSGESVAGALPGTQPGRVAGAADDTGWYEFKLPGGLWRVTPEAARLESSEPAHRELRLLPGETGRADFDVVLREENRDGLLVRVQDPDQRPLGGAWVEAWSLSATGDVGERLAEAVTSASGGARVEGIATGSYRIVGGHDAWLDGSVDLHIGEDEPAPGALLVTLRRGGSIRVRVVNADDAPVSGVTITSTPPEPPDSAPWRAGRGQRTVRADLTGYAKLEGLVDGVHRLVASLEKNSSGRFLRWVEVDAADAAEEALVDLGVGEEREVTLRVLPAAEVGGRVVCADRGRLPAAIDLRVLGAANMGGCDGDRPIDGSPGLVADGSPLEGQPAEEFRVGPLPSGDHVMAVRPGGFERWIWLGSTEPCDPAIVQLTEGELTDVGTIEVDCLPVVRIVPAESDGAETPPDLRQADVSVQAWHVLGDRTEQPLDARRLTVNKRAAAIEIRGAPEGSVRFVVGVRLPALPDVTWQATLSLHPGHTTLWSP